MRKRSPPVPKKVWREIKKNVPISVVADTVKMSRSGVHLWASRGIPIDRAIELSRISGVPVEKIRPDIFQSR